MTLLDALKNKAKQIPQRIVLPEATEIRTLKAADIAIENGLAEIILIGNTADIKQLAVKNKLSNISKAKIIDPDINRKIPVYADLLYNLRKNKGITPDMALTQAKDPLYLACLLIKNGDADGELAGAQNFTADVLRPAFQIIKTMPEIKVVSGAFLMFTNAAQLGENGLLVFADCAVNPNPTAEELASIAVSTAATTRAIAGFEPKIAVLSFSTKGSAQNELVDKVIKAVRLVKEMQPDLQIDGELQVDAALVPSVAASKAPKSVIAGQANVLIFPDLQSGNIGYKLVQRFSGAQAVGPILQGMAAPVNDLSRGCTTEEIVSMIAITANQAIAAKN